MQPVVRLDANLAEFLRDIGLATAHFGSTPCAIVSVRRAADGHACVESWLLDPRATDAFDADCRREARVIADGTNSAGETLVVFAMTIVGTPAVAQVAHGTLTR